MEPYLKLYEDLKAANVSGLPKTSQAFRDKLLNDEEAVYKVLGAVNKLNWDEGSYNLKDTKDADIIREQLGLKKKVATQPSIPFSPDSGTQKLKSFGEQGREELDKPKAEQPLKPVQEPRDFKEIGQEAFPEIEPKAEAPTPFKIEAGIQQLKSETNQYEDYLKTKVELQPVIEANEKLRGQVFEDLQQNKDAFIDKGRWVVNKDNGKRMWVGGRKTKRPELDMYPDEYYQELDMGKMMDFIKAKYPEQSKNYSSGLEAARMDFMNDFYSKRELTPYRDLASQAARADFIKTTGKPDPGTLNSMIAKDVDAAATEADKQVEVLSYRQGKVSENLNKNYTAAANALSNNFTNIAQQQQQQLIKKYEDAVRTGAVKPEQAQGQFQQEFEALNKSLEDKYKADSEAMYKQYTEDIAKANRDIQKDFTDTVEMPFELKKKEALNKADNFYTDEDKKLLSKLYGQQFKGAQLKLREAQKQQYENKDLGLKTRDLFQAGVSDFMRLTGGMIYNGAEEISQVFSATTGANVSVAPYVRSIGEQMQNQGAKFQQTQEALAQDPDAIWGALVRSTPLTVGMLIPAAFVDAAVAGATKGSSMGWLTRAVVAGMVSRTMMESNMEARGAYDEMIAKGESIQKSKEITRGVYEDNQNLMALDILQFGIAGGLVSKTFGKAFSGMSMTATYALERAIDMPTQAFEELYQGYAVAKRENPELSFSDYAVSPEGKVAGATGALMGFAFGTVGDAIRVVRGADQAIQTASLLKMAQVNFGKNRINQLHSMATTMYQQGAFTPQQYQSIQKKLNLIYSQYESLPEGLHESAKAAVLENLYQMEELRAKQQKALDAGSIDLAEAIGQDIEALKKEIPGILNGKEALYSINGVPFSKEVFGRITAQEGFMDELKAGIQDGTLQFWTTDAAFSDKLRDYKPNPIAKQIEDEDIRQAEEQKQPEPEPQPGLPAGSKSAGEPEKKVKLTDLPKQLQDELIPLGYPEDHEFDNQEQAIEIGFGTKDKYVAPETQAQKPIVAVDEVSVNKEQPVTEKEEKLEQPDANKEDEEAINNRISVSGLMEGYAVSKKTQAKSDIDSIQFKEAFDPRTTSSENAKDSFVKIIERKGKKYRVVGLRMSNPKTVLNGQPDRSGMSFASIVDDGNLPSNIDELLIKKAIQEGKDLYEGTVKLEDSDFILPKEYKPATEQEKTSSKDLTNDELLASLPKESEASGKYEDMGALKNAPITIISKDRYGNRDTKARYIPWNIHEKANKNDKLGGQTAREIAQRGGYSDRELDMLYPNWRKEVAELNKQESQSPQSETVKENKVVEKTLDEQKVVVEKKTNTVNGYEFTKTPTLTENDGLRVTAIPKSDADLISQQIFISEKQQSVKEGVTNEGGGWYSFDTDTGGGKTLYNKETGEAVLLDHDKGGRMAVVISDFVKNNDRTQPKQEIKDETEKEITQGESKPQPIKELKARKKGKIKDKNRLKLLDLKGLSPKDQVMQYFMSGGKVPRAAIETFFKGDKEEVKRRFQLWSGKEGLTDIKTLDKLAEALAEDQDTPGRYDDTEFKEALEDVLLGHMSASTMQADMMEKFFPEMPEEARMEAQDDIEAEQIADAMVENMSEEDAAELITMLEAAYGTDMVKLEEDMKAGMLFTGLQEVWERFVENKPMESQAQVEKTITEYIYDKQGKGSRKAKTATKTPEKVQPPKKQREPKPERRQTGKGKDVDDLLDDLGDVLAEPESEYVADGRQPDYGLFGKPEKGKSDYRKDFEAQKQSMAKDLRKMQSDLDAKRKELIARGATAEDMKRILTPMQQALGVQQQKYIDFEQKGEQSVRQAQQAQTDLFAPVQSNVGQLEFESEGQLPRGEDVIYMERLLEVKTGIDFVSGGVRINSSADTAYLMRHMRSFTSENAYVVLHKADGTADVQYLSSGGTTSAIIDIKMVIAAAVDIGAVAITLVHNHPSGNLKPSNNDYKMHSNLTEALEPYGIAVNKSVIIDTDQGLYTEFVSNDYETQKELGQVSGEKKYEVLSFEKQVLYVPSTERDRITSSVDVAQYLSKQKAGTTPAIAMIVLDRANNVNGFFLMDESATDMDILKKAQYEIGKRGEAIILASNRPMGEGNLRYLAKRLDSIGANLLDFVTYKLGDETLKGFKSYRDEGLISEPQEGYGKIKEFAKQWNLNQFGYFPQAFDDAKAKIALKKIGNEYGIKRAQSGGYFLTKNGKLYNPYKASSQIVSEPEGPKRIPLETLSKAQDVLSKLYDKGIKDFDEIAKLIGQRLGEDALNKEIADTGSSFLDGLKAAYGMMQSYYSDLTPMDKVRTYKQGQTKKISDDTDTNTSTESNVSGLRPEDGMGQENVWPEQGRVRQGNNPTVPDLDEKSERPDGSIEPTTNLAVVERERNTSGVSTGQPELFGNVPRGTDTGRSGVRGEARKQPEPSPRTGTEKFVDRDGSESQYATKLNQQKQAESIPVEVGNAKNVAETLPFLLDSQVEDVVKAERRLEVDGEKAILFANGTGTGKGLMSLGVVKRYVKQGKGDIVIVVPKQELIDKAIEEGKLLGLDITALQSTSVAGQGVTITTYANLRANTSLQMRVPDLIIFDESQNILENQDGDISSTTQAARKLFSYGPNNQLGIMKAAESVLGPAPGYAMYNPDTPLDIAAANRLPREEWNAAYEPRKEEFKAMAEANYQKSKVMLLSATPFSGEKALVYTDGLLHDMSDANAFYIQNFGYRIRYSKLTKPEKDVDQGLMQVTFTDRQIQQGKQSVRMIDVPYDYSRDFMLLESASGNMIDLGLRLLSDEYKLGDVVRAAHKGIYYTRLLEQLKAKLIVPVVQDLVNRGFKVVVFHDYNKTEGVSHPFQTLRGFVKNENEKAQLKRFEIDHPEFMELPLSDLQGVIPAFENSMPQESVFLNGENPTKDAVKLFNDDNSGKDVMVVSSSKGNAGFSMHDTTGTKPRVLINIGLPVRPIFAIQTEGRIYRVGQASNAAFIYPIIGTGFEKYKFARIGERTSSTENLALGSIARNLKDIFIQGYIQAATEIDFDALGTGSKEADKGKMQIDTWELARSLYFGQQKKNSRTKAQEGEDYYATPEPIGLKMVEILDLKPGQKFLEPSAGHGAIARWVPEYMDATAIEPSYVLRPMLQLNAPQIKRVEGYDFMSFPTVNKYNGIAMNPPFGVQGKTAAEHVRKAFDHLKNGGRLVAIVPNGKGMERIMTWLQDTPNAVLRQEVRLPSVTFGRAGTQVSTTMVVIDKIDEKGASEVQKPPVYSLDLSGIENINELFDEVKEIGVLEKMGSEDMESQRETAEYLYDKSVDFEKGERIGKDGKTYYTAKPKDRIGDRFKSVAGIANQNSGWYGKFSRSFEFKTELDRESFINAVAGMDDTILSEQPGTYEYYDKKANAEEEKLRQALRDSMRDMSANPFASAAAVVAQATKYLAYKVLAGVKSLSKALAGSGLVPNDFFRKIWDSLRALQGRMYKQPDVPIRTELRGYGLMLKTLPEFKQALNRIYDNQQYKSDMDFLLQQEITAYNTLIAVSRDPKSKLRLQTIKDALLVLQANTSAMSAEQVMKYVYALREAQVEKPVVFDYNPTTFASFMMEMFDTLYPQKVVQRQIQKAGGKILIGRDPYTLAELYESKLAAKQGEFNEKVVSSRRTVTGAVPNPSLLERMVAAGIDLGLDRYEADTPIGRFLEKYVREVSGSAYLKFLTGKQPIPTFPEYLHAIHAKERNELVRKRRQEAFDGELTKLNAEYALTRSQRVLDDIDKLMAGKNPDFPLIDDMGSGMSDSDADAVVNELTNNWPEHLQKYEQFRQQFVDEVVTPIQDELIRSGLVSSDTMDEWNQDMPNWVHLPVDYYSDENVGIGKGVKSRTPIKTITGSMKERVNPLFATILYYNQVLKSAEINTVKRDLLGIVKSYPNEELWRVQRPYMKTEFDIVSGQYIQKASGPPPANAIPVMNNGKTSWIIINDPQLRKAWEQYGIIENRNIVLRLFAAANKLLYLTAIKLNPDFMVSNAIRDIQTALLNVGSDVDAAGMKRDIAKLWLPSIQAMYKAVRGVPANSNVQRLAYEFMQDGGMMSWADAIPGSLENKVKKINDELLAAERYIGSPRYEQAVKNILPYLWDVFGDAQSSLENAARLATYIASRNAGLSRERAAAVAKNVTVNFHKRGEKSGWLNSIYWLFSASAQSIYRTTSGIARSNRLKIAAGLLVSSSSMLSMYNLSRNPEAVMAIPEHMKATGVIFIGNEGDITYRRLPMAYFWNTFKYAGDVAAQVGLGYMSPADGAKQLWIESLSSINPLGYSEDEKAFLENMIPTIARTPLQVSYNRTWYGGMIYPESEFGWKNKDSETYWDETEPNIKAFTEWLSEATGAESKKNEGAIEISPAAMEYVMKTYLGGPYRTAAGIRKFAGDLETKEFTWEKYPITRIFAGRIQSNAIRSEIVEIIDKGQTNPITKQDVNRFNNLVKMRVFQIAENYKSDPIQAERQLKNLQRQISRFGKLRTLDIASEIFRDKNLQELNDLISQ